MFFKGTKEKILLLAAVLLLGIKCEAAQEGQGQDSQTRDSQVLEQYREYQSRLNAIETLSQIGGQGFDIIEEQCFPIETKDFGEVSLVPALEEEYSRLALFLADESGRIVWKTDQLEANSRILGQMKQPIEGISAVSFQDLNGDGLKDIALIVLCVNDSGAYAGKTYKIGDVLFQTDGGFYRDYRISEKINRFSMNKGIDNITAFVRDGYSAEFLYTATTEKELVRNGFVIAQDQHYARQFEKLGRLDVVPGTYKMADFTYFMVYLVNEQGYIVWSFQPMGEYDNLYALKGINCRDIDGDGMKDIIVLTDYSYAGENNELLTKSEYSIYYQRTGGFVTDTEVKVHIKCGEDDTMNALIEKARAYWGWRVEEDD